jgi:glycosyltransferase involved in cell wall biosynthesis
VSKAEPLVSIMIPNRNHSMYLNQSIEGALNQTYQNIEVIVLDNCSTDNSIEVAQRYLDRGVRVCKNPENIAVRTLDVLFQLADGDYLMILPADDSIKPTFVGKCVQIMENNSKVGFVHCDRDLINERGDVTALDPFFKYSFVADGASALPIFMVAEVAQAAQCVMRKTAFFNAGGFETEFDHLNIDRELWFRLALESDYAYIRENLAQIRIHGNRETSVAIRNFYHPLAIYLTLKHQLHLGAIQYGHQNVIDKMPEAEHKLGSELVRLAIAVLSEDKELAEKYLNFAEVVFPDIILDKQFQDVLANCQDGTYATENTKDDRFVYRERSYDPPLNYRAIEI